MLGLRTLLYKVKDLEAAKAWYTNVLGVGPYFDEPFYVGFNVGGFELALDPDIDGVTWGNNQTGYWGVDNIAEVFQRIKATGAEVAADITDVGGGIKVAELLDPSGNRFAIIENPHFKIAG
jgi:predicted enzyme related to lactoylglutathione lyase